MLILWLWTVLSMGTYGAYVWSAYTLVLVLLSVNMVLIQRQRSKTIKILKQEFDHGDGC